MAITVNLRYKGKNGSALAFAKEMTESGTVDLIRAEDGNLNMNITSLSMIRKPFC